MFFNDEDFYSAFDFYDEKELLFFFKSLNKEDKLRFIKILNRHNKSIKLLRDDLKAELIDRSNRNSYIRKHLIRFIPEDFKKEIIDYTNLVENNASKEIANFELNFK